MELLTEWSAAVLCIAYGMMNAFAGLSQLRIKKIQAWAALGMMLFGVIVVAAGILILLRTMTSLWVLLAGLVGIHLLAINNGLKMFRRINPGHHLIRLVVSLVLLALAYLSFK
jgi:hypothetical protein